MFEMDIDRGSLFSWDRLSPEVLSCLKKDDDPENTSRFMSEAIKEAGKGTLPQKKVGVVVVKDGEIVSRSYRGKSHGESIYHAEYVAISECDVILEGASMYVTLEPCSERNDGKGVQEPCVKHIIDSRISNVYIGLPDTKNFAISGNGILQLSKSGVDVYAANNGLEKELNGLVF